MRVLISAIVTIALVYSALEPAASVGAEPKVSGEPGTPPAIVQLRFSDNSILNVAIRDDKLAFTTEFGKLSIPIMQIQKVEFGMRIPEDVAKAIAAAITKLGSDDFDERERANTELLKHGWKAYPDLQ